VYVYTHSIFMYHLVTRLCKHLLQSLNLESKCVYMLMYLCVSFCILLCPRLFKHLLQRLNLESEHVCVCVCVRVCVCTRCICS